MICPTCGARPVGTFRDGSPRFDCSRTSGIPHEPIFPGMPVHPEYAAHVEGLPPIYGHLTEPEQNLVRPIAKKVAERYERGRVAKMKFAPGRRPIIEIVTAGLGAELFVARWAGLEWNRGNARKPDVGADVEVRTTRRSDGMLALYTRDHGNRRYVFTIGSYPSYRIVGWIRGRDALAERYWHPKGAVVMGVTLDVDRFLVPAKDLQPMYEFERA